MGVELTINIVTVIAGQTFCSFTFDSLRSFGRFRAMGAANSKLVRMIVLRTLVVGAIGYGLDVGAASLFGAVTQIAMKSEDTQARRFEPLMNADAGAPVFDPA